MCSCVVMISWTIRSHQSQFNQPNFVGFPNSYDFSSGTPSCRALPHWRHSSAFKCESCYSGSVKHQKSSRESKGRLPLKPKPITSHNYGKLWTQDPGIERYPVTLLSMKVKMTIGGRDDDSIGLFHLLDPMLRRLWISSTAILGFSPMRNNVKQARSFGEKPATNWDTTNIKQILETPQERKSSKLGRSWIWAQCSCGPTLFQKCSPRLPFNSRDMSSLGK